MVLPFFWENEDIDHGVSYSKRQKSLVTVLSLILALIFIVILTSSQYGNIERNNICDSKEYIYKDVCSDTLKDSYVIFKYSDNQVAEAVKEVKASANDTITKKSKELQMEGQLLRHKCPSYVDQTKVK